MWLVAAALSIALGVRPDLGAIMIGAFVIPASLYFYGFWRVEDQAQRQVQTQLFFRNVIVLGASFVFFALFSWSAVGLRYSLTGPLFSLR